MFNNEINRLYSRIYMLLYLFIYKVCVRVCVCAEGNQRLSDRSDTPGSCQDILRANHLILYPLSYYSGVKDIYIFIYLFIYKFIKKSQQYFLNRPVNKIGNRWRLSRKFARTIRADLLADKPSDRKYIIDGSLVLPIATMAVRVPEGISVCSCVQMCADVIEGI